MWINSKYVKPWLFLVLAIVLAVGAIIALAQGYIIPGIMCLGVAILFFWYNRKLKKTVKKNNQTFSV